MSSEFICDISTLNPGQEQITITSPRGQGKRSSAPTSLGSLVSVLSVLLETYDVPSVFCSHWILSPLDQCENQFCRWYWGLSRGGKTEANAGGN